MKIYKNRELTEEITILDLGIVMAGDTAKYKFYIQNDSNAELRQLKCSVESDEVKIISCPENLSTWKIGELELEWSPNITLKQGLKTNIKFSGFELWL